MKKIYVSVLFVFIFFSGCAGVNAGANGNSNVDISGHVGYEFGKSF